MKQKIYRQLENFIAEIQFDRLGFHLFTPENTNTYLLKDTISKEKKEKENLMFIQQEISLRKTKKEGNLKSFG